MRVLAGICAGAATLGLIACGGGEETQSEEDFIAEVDAYCVERQQANLAVLEDMGGPRAPADSEEQLQQSEATLPIVTETTEGLADFDPPAELQDRWEHYVSQRQDALEMANRALDAGRSGDQKEYEATLGEYGELRDETDALAEDLGLRACAGELSPEDTESITAVIEEVATTSAPEQCTELFTENYLDGNFGKEFGDATDDPLKACEQFQADTAPGDLAKSVELGEARGPEPYATVEVTEVGGVKDGEPSAWRLVEEDGEWRVSDIVLTSG
jgi:hypothetical protein